MSGKRDLRGAAYSVRPRVAAALPVCVLMVQGLGAGAVAAGDDTPGMTINGGLFPSIKRAQPSSGFVGGAPGLPGIGDSVEREPAGSHGLPPSSEQNRAAADGRTGPGGVQRHEFERGTVGWSDVEVMAARARCQRALTGLDAHFTYVPQVKSGACGTPTPIELSGFGKGLVVSPPIIVTCDLAATLHAWMRTHIQPLAKRHLGTSITQINTMSSYSCRNTYGAKKAPLSQHAFANAIDVRGFVTAKGQLLDVELHWGPTTKELATYQASLQRGAANDMTTASIPARGVPSESWMTAVAAGATRNQPSFPVTMHSAAEDARAKAAAKPGAILVVATGQPASAGPPPLQFGQQLDGRAHFLRQAWQGACTAFTTVLGPEANRAHRNHLHVDLAQRKSGAFCQ